VLVRIATANIDKKLYKEPSKIGLTS